MLALLNSFQVPGLSHITIYPDHQSPYKFYYLREVPRVCIDSEGIPQMSYMMIARNAEKAVSAAGGVEANAEVQLGYLNLTVDLGLTKDEHEQILEFLSEMVGNTNSLIWKNQYLLYKYLGFSSSYDKSKIVLLGANTWSSGTAKIELLEGLGDTFKKTSSSEVVPSLGGNCPASFYAAFGDEGAQLMFDALRKGVSIKNERAIPVQAVVRYNLKGYAFVPSLKATVSVHTSKVYEFFDELNSDSDARDRYIRRNLFGWGTRDFYYSVKEGMHVSKNVIEETFSKYRDNKIISINIEDYAGLSANDKDSINDTIIRSLIQMVTDTIIPKLFEQSLPEVGSREESGEQSEKMKAEYASEMKGAASNADAGKKVERGRTFYRLRKSENNCAFEDITFRFNKSGTCELMRAPQGSVMVDLAEDDLKGLVRVVDISDPAFQMLSVPVSVNADFEADGIRQIDVQIAYDQFDASSGSHRRTSKAFVFESSETRHTFRATMARDAQGNLLDSYKVKSRMTYKPNHAHGNNDGSFKEFETNDRSVVISYEKLGFINVKAKAGDIDWDVIKEAIVMIEYLGANNKPDTKAEMHMTKDNPAGNWTCYMYNSSERKYKYRVRYIYSYGREIERKDMVDVKEQLVINDMLVGRLSATFDVVMDTNTVSRAKIEVLYEDPKHGVRNNSYHWFEGTDSWDWSIRMEEGADSKYKYRYFVQYADGKTATSAWSESCNAGEDVPKFTFRRYPVELTIEGSTLNWEKWAFALVSIKYEDPANDYTVNKMVRMSADTQLMQLQALAFSEANNKFRCTAQLVSKQGTKVTLEEQECSGFFILTDPEGTENPLTDV